MKEVYYWKDISWLVFFTYNKFGKNTVITFPRHVFLQEWVKLPVACEDVPIEEVFAKFNNDENPMGTPDNQEWLKQNNLTHTSMSVGDIVKKNDKFFVCLSEGWREIKLFLPEGE